MSHDFEDCVLNDADETFLVVMGVVVLIIVIIVLSAVIP